MSLFDNDFILEASVTASEQDSVLEAAKKKEDCDDCDEKDKDEKEDAEDGEGDGEEEEMSEEEEKEAEEAAEFDLECDSLQECMGSPALRESEEEMHFFSLEAMAINMAFDKTDAACTEAYISSNTIEEKEAITEGFKDSVKKYWERFKGFITKVKNMIVRTAIRVAGYFKHVFAKTVAKINTYSKDVKFGDPGDAEITIYPGLKKVKQIKDIADKMATHVGAAEEKYKEVAFAGASDIDVVKSKEQLSDLPVPKKANVLKAALGGEPLKVKVKDLITGDVARKQLQDVNKWIEMVQAAKKTVLADVDKAQANFSKAKDIDTAKMSIKIAAINKLVACYNVKLSALSSLVLLFINSRVKIMKACMNGAKEVKEVQKNSATMFESFYELI